MSIITDITTTMGKRTLRHGDYVGIASTRFTFYEGVSKSLRTGRLEQELQMIQLSANRCSCIAIL